MVRKTNQTFLTAVNRGILFKPCTKLALLLRARVGLSGLSPGPIG